MATSTRRATLYFDGFGRLIRIDLPEGSAYTRSLEASSIILPPVLICSCPDIQAPQTRGADVIIEEPSSSDAAGRALDG